MERESDDSPLPEAKVHGKAFGAFLILLGLLCFVVLIPLAPPFLRVFSDDKQLSAHALSAARATQLLFVIAGFALVGLGAAAIRWNLFRMLDGRDRLARTLFLVAALGFLVFAAELVLRNYPLPTLREELSQTLAYDVSAYSMHRLADRDFDLMARGSNTLKARIRGGYRGEPFAPEKPTGECRIVILGGSFVFDTKAPLDRDWPHLVEVALRARGLTQCRVINGGVPGHGTLDAVGRLLAEVHLYDPDIVVLCDAWNDMKYFNQISREHTPLRVIRPLPHATHDHYPPAWWQNLLDRVALVRLVRAIPRRFGNWGEEGRLPEGEYADSVNALGLEQYRVNVASFVDICRDVGATPVVCTQPHLPTATNREEVKERVGYHWVLLTHAALCRAFQGCEEAVRAVAAEKRCACIDLAEQFSGQSELFVDHVHLNGRGSAAIAEAVAQGLEGIVRAKRTPAAAPAGATAPPKVTASGR